MFTITPKQTRDEIIHCISVGLVPYIVSSPGMGKSSIVAKVADQGGLKLLDLRLSQCTPEDLQGFPMRTGNKATFTPFDIFPLESDTPPEGFNGWLLLLDEMSSAPKPVQAAAYKLVLDRMVGSFSLNEKCAIVCAGNKITDRAVVTTMSTALQSRLIHYEMTVTLDDWQEWAIATGIDHRIIGFLNFSPSKLMDFDPDHKDKTFACPRTWEFLSRLIKNQDVSSSIGARVSGTIGQGVAVEFITFAQEYTRLPNFKDLMSDPENYAIPPEASTKYATISMLIERHTNDNIGKIIQYVERFPVELQIVFARSVIVRSPKIRTENKDFSRYAMDMMSRYI